MVRTVTYAREMRAMLGVCVFGVSVAAADPAPDVNLLNAAPAVVAVSLTVENKTILPAHLVDGKRDTA